MFSYGLKMMNLRHFSIRFHIHSVARFYLKWEKMIKNQFTLINIINY